MDDVLIFGPFELDTERGELRKSGTTVRLRRQALQALVGLASRPLEVVTREELRHLLWGEHIFVDFKEGLNTCIKQVRTALGDDAERPIYLETVLRQGWHSPQGFSADVQFMAAANSSAVASLPMPSGPVNNQACGGRSVVRARCSTDRAASWPMMLHMG